MAWRTMADPQTAGAWHGWGRAMRRWTATHRLDAAHGLLGETGPPFFSSAATTVGSGTGAGTTAVIGTYGVSSLEAVGARAAGPGRIPPPSAAFISSREMLPSPSLSSIPNSSSAGVAAELPPPPDAVDTEESGGGAAGRPSGGGVAELVLSGGGGWAAEAIGCSQLNDPNRDGAVAAAAAAMAEGRCAQLELALSSLCGGVTAVATAGAGAPPPIEELRAMEACRLSVRASRSASSTCEDANQHDCQRPNTMRCAKRSHNPARAIHANVSNSMLPMSCGGVLWCGDQGCATWSVRSESSIDESGALTAGSAGGRVS